MDQDEEVKQLTQLRDSLRLLLQVEGKEVRKFIVMLLTSDVAQTGLTLNLQINCVSIQIKQNVLRKSPASDGSNCNLLPSDDFRAGFEPLK